MEDNQSNNLFWHPPQVTREDREQLQGHRGCVVWLTGLSGAGKSTLAHAAERGLHERGVRTFTLDGDNIRHGLNAGLGFSESDRSENLRRIGEVCKLFVEAGVVVLAAFISPFQRDRERIRSMLPHGDFLEIYVQCPLEVCEARDPKGIYARARKGEIASFTGVSAPYERPVNPEMTVQTDMENLEGSVERLIRLLVARGVINEAV